MSENITLNCKNFFTYFAFHPQDARLSKKDRKVATIATIAFAFSIVGHAVCRLFFYKKILFTQAKDKTRAVGEKQLKQKSDSENAPKSTASSVVQLTETPKVIPLPKIDETADTQPQVRQSSRQVSNVGTVNPSKSQPKVSKIVPFTSKVASSQSNVIPQPKLIARDSPQIVLQPEVVMPQSQPIEAKDTVSSQPFLSPKQQKIISLAEAKAKLQQEVEPAKKSTPKKRFVLSELMKASSPKRTMRQGTISEEQMVGCDICSDEAFKHTRLIDWEKAKKDYPKLDKQVQRRLRELDKIIHFSHRIRSLEDKSHLPLLTMDDLQQPLLDSPLDLAISTADELGSVVGLETFNDAQLAMVRCRLPSLKAIEIKDIRGLPMQLTVLQLHSLTGQQLSKLIDDMPINYAKLISDEQFAEMEFSLLKERHKPLLQVLLEGRVLSVKQFYSCYELLTPSQQGMYDLKQLSEDQVKSIKFTKPKLDILKQILNSEEKMAWLSKEQLRDCWSALDKELVSLISIEQIKQMDGNFTLDIHKFDALFPVVGGESPWKSSNIQHLKLVQLIIHGNFFTDDHLKYLTSEQIQAFNLSDGFGLRILENVILKNSVGEERLKEIFQQLKPDQQKIVESKMKKKLYKRISRSESATV